MRFEPMFLMTCLALAGCMAAVNPGPQAAASQSTPKPEGLTSLVLGGGCFWCIEPLFERLKAVHSVEVGYAGGSRPNVSYEQVCTGVTGHAEVVKVDFDPKALAPADLLRVFFTIHDPTTKNRQGPDEGPQYRSVVFYSTDEEKAAAQKVIDEINQAKIWKNPIVTTLEPLKNYTRAEEEHQDYYEKFEKASALQKMSMNAGYCRVVIEPKVTKFRQQFAHLMK